MRVIQFSDPHEFANRVQPMLMQRECENCWQLGAIDRLCRNLSTDIPPLMLAIETGDEILGVAMQTASFAMVVTQLPMAGVEALVEKMRSLN